ncbi:MAG: DUF3011 domain-containing protein [Pyrinomonadaceae bacterium]|nr:DUF3011 domain-containing protein [Pyrinomonadaceae bacterium]MBP6212261.1 DUF3011 domain-containing protein [Pyrinomonadaceae bacterium]
MKQIHTIFIMAVLVLTVIGPAGVQHVAAQNKMLTCGSTGGNYNYCRVDTDNRVRLERKLSISDCVYGSSWGYDKRGIWVDRGCRAEFAYGGSSSTGAITAGAIIGGLVLAGALASRNKDSSSTHYSNTEVYNLGFKDGQADSWANRINNPDSHRYEYDSKYRTDFRNGYNAGYTAANNAKGGSSNSGNAYSNGFSRGSQDARSNLFSDYRRYRNQYNWNNENDFQRGYDAGYRDNQNSWGYSGGGYSSVPNYFIGTFRGYTPANQTWTDITIYSDGSIRIQGQNGDKSNGYYRDGAATFGWGTFRLKREGNGFTAVDPNNRAASVFYSRIR